VAETCLFDLNPERLLSGSGHRNLNIECVLGAQSRHLRINVIAPVQAAHFSTACLLDQMHGDDAVNDIEHLARDHRTTDEEKAQLKWKTGHPLGEDEIVRLWRQRD
jgi:hypothetical protein